VEKEQEEEEQEERSLEEMLKEEEEERREMESFPPDEFVDPEDEEEGEREEVEELVASTSAAAGSKGPTLSQQLKAMKELLASKVAELDAANALLVHAPNNIRKSQPNPNVAPVFVPPVFGSNETIAASQARVSAAANSEEQRQLRGEERAAPKDKVCSTRGCNTVLLP
jgi:hypothetical protein